jgi:hypothetical protein
MSRTIWSSTNIQIRGLAGSSGKPKRSSKSQALYKQSKNGNSRSKTKDKSSTKGIVSLVNLNLYIPFYYKTLGGTFPESKIHEMITKQKLYHDNLIRHHGIVDGTKRFKDVGLYALHLTEGRSPSKPSWVRTGLVDKWPSKLHHLRPVYHLLKDNKLPRDDRKLETELRRFLLTMLKINRVVAHHNKVETKDLQQKFLLQPSLVNDFTKFVKIRLASVSSDIVRNKLRIEPVFGSARGPNSMPKTESALKEAYAICHRHPKFLEAFTNLCEETNNPSFLNYLKHCSSKYESELGSVKKTEVIKLRKLTSIPDAGNKSRTIAICDFWTQCALATLEKVVVRITSNLFNKHIAFFDHHAGWKNILKQDTHLQRQLVSLDATNWTDNLPNALQYIVLQTLFGTHIAKAWKSLSVECEWHVHGSDLKVKYGRGQGMGTRGSFAIAQLTNLLFIEFIYSQQYPDLPSPYFMEVGDDMVVQDPDLKFSGWFEAIGVPVNISKSKFSTVVGNFVEFVSRNGVDGHDYSIVSPNLVVKASQNDFYLLTLQRHLRERGVQFTLEEMFQLKHDSLKFQDKNVETFNARRSKNLLLASLLKLGFPSEEILLEENYLSYLDTMEDIHIKNFLVTLAYMPVLKLIAYSESHYKADLSTKKARAYLFTCVDQYKASLDKDIWAVAQKFDWSPKMVKAVSALVNLDIKKNQRIESGTAVNSDESWQVPQAIELVLNSDGSSSAVVNNDYLTHVYALNRNVNDIVNDYRVSDRVSLFDNRNHAVLLQLMADLNRCVNARVVIGDADKTSVEVIYRTGNELSAKEEKVELDLTHTYLQELRLLNAVKTVSDYSDIKFIAPNIVDDGSDLDISTTTSDRDINDPLAAPGETSPEAPNPSHGGMTGDYSPASSSQTAVAAKDSMEGQE